MKLKTYIVNIFLICRCFSAFAQVGDTTISIPTRLDSNVISNDSISFAGPRDTITPLIDSTNIISENVSDVKIASGGLDDVIDYGAKDSSFIDVKLNQIHLFGEAYVKYKEYNLKAGYIIFDLDNNEASAFQLEMPSGRKIQKPDFTDGTNAFTSTGLRFNFETNKGLIFDARTTEGEYTIHGSRTKFVSGEETSDTTSNDDQIYNQDARITTCNADHPHYSIRTRKLKIIPDKLAIMGLSQLELMGIPTPIILPFGFFPLVEGRSSGLIFPNNYEYNDQLGLGFREVGYYFPINDYLDMRVTGDIYTRGTHRLNVSSNYKRRYKYRGNVTFSYANNIGESASTGARTSNKSFALKVSHTQDPKAHPYQNIGGTINLTTNLYDQTNSTAYEDVVNNKIRSNFFYKHSMPGTPFSFSTAFTHNQDNKTRKVDITLPDAKLRMNTIYPFKGKAGGQESWHEKINVGYDAKFKNYVSATDTTLFSDETLENLQTGLSHKATARASFNVLKYFNLNTSSNFEQFVFTRKVEKDLDPTLYFDTLSVDLDQDGKEVYTLDTMYGQVNDIYINGLTTVEKFDMNANLSTQLFATKKFSKGWLRGVRHTMKPSVGFSYSPDTKDRYEREVLSSSNPNEIDEVTAYNPYRNGIFNPSLSAKQMALTYQISNFFEGKYFSKKDSTEKKFKLLQAFNVSGRYNFAADSIKFSPLSVRGNTSLFKGVTNVNFSASYNFYKKDENGKIINELVWDSDKRPFEFDNFMVTVSNGFTVGKILDMFSSKKSKEPSSRDQPQSRGQNGGQNNAPRRRTQSLGDFVENFRFSHSFRYEIDRLPTGRDTSYVRAHSVKLSGQLELSDNWNLSVNNIEYDLVNKKFVYPQFTLNRDLHCWNMSFSWTPAIEVYSFFIGVKSSSLSFLKYNYGQRSASQLLGRPR